MTTNDQLIARLKNFLTDWFLGLGLKECLVECATLCVKSEVILTWSDWPFWQQIFFKISGFRIHPSKANFCKEWQDSNIFLVKSCWILQLLINKSFNLQTFGNLTISWTDGIQTDFKDQIISECPYEIIVSPIRPMKKFMRFLP